MFRTTWRLVLLAGCGLLFSSASSRAAFTVDVLNPATNPAIFDSWLFAINNNGLATGYVGLRAGFRYTPVTYQNGQITALAPLDPTFFYFYNTGRSINDAGQVVGPSGASTFLGTAGGTAAVLPPAGVAIDFGGPQARINNRGDILVPGYDEATFGTQLVLVQNGVPTALSAFDPLFTVGDPNTGDGYSFLASNVWLTD